MCLRRRVLSGCLAFLLCLGFSGCATSLIPGENAKILQHLAASYYDIAQKYAELKTYDKAIANYTLAARDKDFRKPAQYQLARMYALSSKWMEAERAFEALLKQDPDNITLKSSLAYVYAQVGKLDEAETMYVSLLEKDPQHEQLQENYIRVLHANKKPEDAAAQLEVFVGQFPDSKALEGLRELLNPTPKDPAEEDAVTEEAGEKESAEETAESAETPEENN
jgi:tetratricopeptide (TPR) repeat protein